MGLDGPVRVIANQSGDLVNFPVSPVDAGGIFSEFMHRTGTGDTEDLRVDGSITPVDFTVDADPAHDILVNEISVAMAANNIVAGSGKFAGLTRLTNGLHFYYYNGSSEISIDSIHQNEDFIHFASPGGYGFWVLNQDQVVSQLFVNGIIVLHAGTTEKLIVRIADDLDSGINYLKCKVKGAKRM